MYTLLFFLNVFLILLYMYMQQSAAPWGHINIYVQYRVATYSIALSLLVCARCFYSCCSYCSYYLLVLYIYICIHMCI
jgi:hypothetical protein